MAIALLQLLKSVNTARKTKPEALSWMTQTRAVVTVLVRSRMASIREVGERQHSVGLRGLCSDQWSDASDWRWAPHDLQVHRQGLGGRNECRTQGYLPPPASTNPRSPTQPKRGWLAWLVPTPWRMGWPPNCGPFRHWHGSWLKIIEVVFSKIARRFLRHVCMSSQNELKTRTLAEKRPGVAVARFTFVF
jgi:hypothetical protein